MSEYDLRQWRRYRPDLLLCSQRGVGVPTTTPSGFWVERSSFGLFKMVMKSVLMSLRFLSSSRKDSEESFNILWEDKNLRETEIYKVLLVQHNVSVLKHYLGTFYP